ncbi:hypothetical protein [Marinifilum flexuosum]|uniref:hypothetical protein n=1 Tax=Marinifilum flexuosum TaxID=1117708 RepID=UPI002491AC4C|nr:hypothetical protein [Marinifilum flexuosum]
MKTNNKATNLTKEQQDQLSLTINKLSSKFAIQNHLSSIVAKAILEDSDNAFELLEVYIMTAFASTGSRSTIEDSLWFMYETHFKNATDKAMKDHIYEMLTEIFLKMEEVTPDMGFLGLADEFYSFM